MSDVENAVEAVDSTEVVDSEPSVVDAPDAGVAEEEAFFRWKPDPKAEETVFKKPAELADFLRHSGMRKQDYEAAMSQVKERMKQAEEIQKRYHSQESLTTELASKWKAIDDMMAQNPQFDQAVKQLYQRMAGGGRPDPQGQFDKLLEEKLKPIEQFKSEYEKEREQRAAEQRREQAFQRLKADHPDADLETIEKYLESFNGVPEQDREYMLLRAMHHAVRGQMSPAELERRAAMAKHKRGAAVTSTPGKRQSEIDVSKLDPEQIRQRALAEIGAIEEG